MNSPLPPEYNLGASDAVELRSSLTLLLRAAESGEMDVEDATIQRLEGAITALAILLADPTEAPDPMSIIEGAYTKPTFGID